MDGSTHTLCEMIRRRSVENRQAMNCFPSPYAVLSPAFSILRQELDSMVRVIYLLTISDDAERVRLIRSTLQGDSWRIQTPKGKLRKVQDRELIDLAQNLQGWTQSVYKFGCAFIHLSDYHNHNSENPFEKLLASEKADLLKHMRYYHDGPPHDNPSMKEISHYIPMVFDKIATNLESYLKQLEQGDTLDISKM